LDITEYVTGLKITEVMSDFSTVHKTRLKPLKPIETYSGKSLDMSDYQEVPINTEDHATVMLRFDNGSKGSITVSQVSAGRKNRLNIEIAGSKSNFEFNSERPNELWIGKREKANESLMKDPSLLHPQASALVSFPGGHNEGFPDTSKQMFKEVYAAVLEGKQPENPSYPSFASGLRELIIGERIIESHKKQAWVKI
jgi:predicted dehydrogenase